MATTLQLTDGTNTVDLNDGAAFTVMQNGFAAPPPRLKTKFAGSENVSRSGEAIPAGSEYVHENRTVRLELLVIGADTDTLATNVQNVEAQLRRAQEFSAFGWGSQMQLKLQWGLATNPVYFNVLTGSFDPVGIGSHNVELVGRTRLVRRILELRCEPYAVGDVETVENHLRDAGFEVAGTALADWTADSDATGSDDVDTTRFLEGAQSLKLDITSSAAGGEKQSRYQERTAAAGETWSTVAWCEPNDITADVIFVLHTEFRDATSALVEYEDWIDTADAGTFSQMKIEGKVAPTGTTLVRFWIETRAIDASADGTGYFDKCGAFKAATVPTTWASGREVMNHFDDDGQLHVNYLDVEDVPGDIPAQMQLKATENEAHTAFWVGARHAALRRNAGIFHEVEDFLDANGTSLIDVAEASASSGQKASIELWAQFDGSTSTTGTASSGSHSHTVGSNESRLIILAIATEDTVTHNTPTVDGEDMTQIVNDSSGSARLSVWYYVAPSVGSVTVAYSFSGSADYAVASASYYGVDQTTPVGMAADTGAWATDDPDATDAFTTIAGGIAFGALMHGDTATPNGGETEREETAAFGAANWKLQIQDERATSASTTSAWDFTGANTHYGAGFGINPVGATPTNPAVFTKAIATPPEGAYRVLVRVNEQGTAADVRLGIGYSYGDVTFTPSVAAEYQAVAGGTFAILDLGILRIPRARELPNGVTAPTFTLRLAAYSAEASYYNDALQIDWLMLLPVDYGSGYLTKTSGTNVVLSDSRSMARGFAIIDASDVLQSWPASQGGTPPMVHPEGTRIYFAHDNGAGADIDDGWTVSVTVRPRYLSVAGT